MEKDKSNVKWNWAIAILCVLWILALILYVRLSTSADYRHSRNLSFDHIHSSEYAKALDIDTLTYEAVFSRYGFPTQLWVEQGDQTRPRSYTAEYPGFSMTYIMTEILEDKSIKKVPELVLLTMTDDSIRFGERQISVGSTREEIDAAYAGDQVIEASRLSHGVNWFPNVDTGYYGDYWCRILFRYDEDGRVEAMAYAPSAFW